MEFEWDEDKRQSNIAKHGIDFEDAADLFDGRSAVTTTTTYELEDRQQTIGQLYGRFIIVVWTTRGNAIRVISARRAQRKEVDRFLKSNFDDP